MNQIIKNVIADFKEDKKYEGQDITSSLDILEKGLRSIYVNQKVNEHSPEFQYAMLLYILYQIWDKLENCNTNDENELKSLFISVIPPKDKENIEIESYKHIPEELVKVYEISAKIFHRVLEHYNDSTANTHESQECLTVESLYNRLKALREKVENINDLYRDTEEIISIYNYELSESYLDMKFLTRDIGIISYRMRKNIKQKDRENKEVMAYSAYENPYI